MEKECSWGTLVKDRGEGTWASGGELAATVGLETWPGGTGWGSRSSGDIWTGCEGEIGARENNALGVNWNQVWTGGNDPPCHSY